MAGRPHDCLHTLVERYERLHQTFRRDVLKLVRAHLRHLGLWHAGDSRRLHLAEASHGGGAVPLANAARKACGDKPARRAKKRLKYAGSSKPSSRAQLLKRVFDLDLQHCPNCGGELKIIAAILEHPLIEKILTHLGLQARAPPRAPARGSQLQAA